MLTQIAEAPSGVGGNTTCSWSGGKDSCFALMKAISQGYKPKVLLNVLNEAGKISRSHGIPAEILEAQAKAAGLPIHLISSSWQSYEVNFIQALQQLAKQYDLQHAVFGDIDLQAHRDWEEKVCSKAGLQAILPLWQQDRRQLVNKMLESQIETIIVSCNEVMGERFLGKTLTPSLIDELEALDVDACGENGEFHTLVLNCPLFSQRLQVKIIENGHFVALVPFWAIWPYETMIVSKRHVEHLLQLTAGEKRAYAEILKKLTARYDNLFQISFPYSAGLHQSPVNDGEHPEWHFHMHFYPPLLRSATVKKFMVGYEMLANPQRDITAEWAAEKLRSLSDVHYKEHL